MNWQIKKEEGERERGREGKKGKRKGIDV